MTLWDYVHEHPVLSFLALGMVLYSIDLCVMAIFAPRGGKEDDS